MTLTLRNATVQCAFGGGIYGYASTLGSPTVTIEYHTTLQNISEEALEMDDGTATVSSSLIQFNDVGVIQYGQGIPSI